MPPQDTIDDVTEPFYLKTVRFFLSYLGIWPYEKFMGTKPPIFNRNGKLLLVIWTLLFVSASSFTIKNRKILNFGEMGHCYFAVCINMVQLQRCSTSMTKSFKNTLAKFVQKIHLVHFKDCDEYSKKTYMKIENLLKYFGALAVFQTVSGVFCFNLVPLVNNYRLGMFGPNKPENETLKLATYLDLPFDYTSHFGIKYIIMLVAVVFYAFDVGTTMQYIDFLITIIIIHVWGHVKVLRYKLNTFPMPEMQGHSSQSVSHPPWYSRAENETVNKLLKECIQYHKFIKDYTDEISSTFGFTLCFYHLYYLVSGCILLVECTLLDTSEILQYIPMTLNINYQLIQVSLVFELLRSESEKLKDAAYGMPWECMDIKNRKILLFYLVNLQEPLVSKAMGILTVGVETMAAIMRTSFSYFMLLRTLAGED